jgi:predicted dehydrogenase
MADNISRKDFLKNSALGMSGLALGSLTPSAASTTERLERRDWKKQFSPNDQIQIAAIGMGIIANYSIPTALEVPGVEFVAAADCYESRLTHVKEVYGKDIFTTQNYQEILDRSDVDAVIISAPDHWHARMSIDAMNAGKDVYCEKPMVHKVEEGSRVIQAQKKTGRVMQVGSQFASDLLFKKAAELYQSGAIGKLNQVAATYNRNSALGAWQYSIPEDATPETVDWESFLGNAPEIAWDPKRFFRWRCYWDYGTGVPGDLYVHLFTAVHSVTGGIGPTQISAAGGLRSWHDGREVPDVIMGQYSYPETDAHPEFTLVLQSNLADGSGGGTRFQFIGDEGVIAIDGDTVRLIQSPRQNPSVDQLVNGYNSVTTFSEKVQKEFEQQLEKARAGQQPQSPKMNRTEEFQVPQGYSSRLDHLVNFFDAIRNGSSVVEDPAFGFRAAAPALLTNSSYKENRIIQWDPVNMRINSA